MTQQHTAFTLLILLMSTLAVAQTPWPEAPKLSYVDRCSESMASQGLAKNSARSYCSCIAEGMSNEFGLELYNQMMNAQPNPQGSEIERRLYKVYSGCSSMLPH